MQHPKSRNRAGVATPRTGFTLIQLLVVLAILAVLASIFMTVFRGGQATAKRAQCDVNLKAITIALDAYRQENGRFPEGLQQLVSKKYLQGQEMLRCPSDPDPASQGYEPFYIIREPRDTGELPILVCPFHEADGYGAQAYKGTYTKQYTAAPAVLLAASDATVQRPGEVAVVGRSMMELHGGDLISTGTAGSATLQFYDKSTTILGSGTKIKVLQSFIEGQSQNAPVFTLLRQIEGTSTYKIITGNKFDIVTPTATAGALGTEFDVSVGNDANGESITAITWKNGNIALTTLDRTVEVERTANKPTTNKDKDKKHKPRRR